MTSFPWPEGGRINWVPLYYHTPLYSLTDGSTLMMAHYLRPYLMSLTITVDAQMDCQFFSKWLFHLMETLLLLFKTSQRLL